MSLRASDADRERVARSLRQHLLDGRLSADEFEDRIGDAYEAKTLAELHALTRDLPQDGGKRPARSRRLLPGNRAFATRFETNAGAAEVISKAMHTIAPDLMGARFQLEQSAATRLVFRRRQIPFYAFAAAVLIPIFGLIVLFTAGRETSEVVVSANELGPGRTAVDVFGRASFRVRRAMLELND